MANLSFLYVVSTDVFEVRFERMLFINDHSLKTGICRLIPVQTISGTLLWLFRFHTLQNNI